MTSHPWIASQDALTLAVRLTPKGGRDALEGVEIRSDGKPVVKARVRALPQDGEANAALRELLATALQVAARDVEIIAGGTARVKRVCIRGDGPALALRLQNLLEQHKR